MNLCYEIARHLYRLRLKNKPAVQENRRDSRLAYWRWQFESSKNHFASFFDLDDKISGKRVLDIGCGIGGRTCYLAGRNPEIIIGTDIQRAEIDIASDIADKQLDDTVRKRVQFMTVNENEPPALNSFDIVLLIDALEHIREPLEMLNYAYSVLKPGGLFYFSTLGWYHHNGFHFSSIIPIPWAHFFFSDRQILDAVRKIVSAPYYQPNMWDSVPPQQRYEGIYDLKDRPGEFLNKITIRDIKRIMKESEFKNGTLYIQGFSWKKFPVLRVFNVLAKVPFVQEVYHAACFGRLEKKK